MRCGVNLLLQCTAVALAAAGGVAAAALATQRALALEIINVWTVAGLAAATAVAVLAWWLLSLPGRMAVAVMVDERLGLRERFSTALALADSDDPFARAARAEAQARAQGVHIRQRFPIGPSRRWAYAGGAWVIAAAIFAFMPPMDLLGYLAHGTAEQAKKEELDKAKTQVRQLAKKIEMAVSPLADPRLATDLANLDKLKGDAPAADVRREAIRKLGDLSEQLKEKLKTDTLTTAAAMRQMLRGIRGTQDALSRELSAALAKGNFDRAAKLVQQMQKDIAEGKLSPSECKALAEQLGELGRQVGEAGDPGKLTEELLESEGLDKKLAGLSREDLRKALKDQGMSDEEIDRLMEKLSSLQQACGSCQGLGESMGELSEAMELTPEELAELLEQLQEMALLDAELGQCEGALGEIERAIALLGEGQEGCIGSWQEGLALVQAPGTGGPGRGSGPRNETATPTALQKIRTNTKTGKGPLIASWYFKGPQAKGETKKDFAQVVQAARDRAAEAINENKIPRKHARAVKEYYDRLNKSGGGSEPPE